MDKAQFDKMKLVSSLVQIGHGDLSLFTEAGLPAAKAEPLLFAHLVAWNHAKSEVLDSKVAFPPIALRGLGKGTDDLAENAIAAMMLLGPRELVRSYKFSSALTKGGSHIPGAHRRMLESALREYLAMRERNRGWWDKAVVSNRQAMRSLYAFAHYKPADWAKAILFEHKYPKDSVFDAIATLSQMTPQQAAGAVLVHKIPLPIAVGALGKMKGDQTFLLALIEQTTGNQLLNATAMFERLGVMSDPVLKTAYMAAVDRAKTDRKTRTLKAKTVTPKVGKSTAAMVQSVQTARLEKLGGIDGDWLVLGDRSGSMTAAIEAARQISALIAQQVKGKVYLVLFNTEPSFVDVTGANLEQIEAATKHFNATGGTAIGVGLQYLLERGLLVNGIVIVSDGGQRHPPDFPAVYKKYAKKFDIEPSVNFMHVTGSDPDWLTGSMEQASIEMARWELGEHVDHNSLPNIVKALKAGRFGLLDEIMAMPLLTFSGVRAAAERGHG